MSLFSTIKQSVVSAFDSMDELVVEIATLPSEDFVTRPVREFAEEFGLDMIHIEALDDIVCPSALYYPVIPVVAGGYLRRWFNGESFFEEMDCDIDIYCRAGSYTLTETSINPLKKNHPQEYLAREGFIKYLNMVYEPTSDCEYGFGHNIGHVEYMGKSFEVQVMQRSFVMKYGQTVAELLKTYDMTLSMIGYDPNTKTITYHKNFIKMNKDKVMDFNKTARINSPATQMARFMKLSDEGYTASPGLYREFCDWTYNAYNANGGTSPGDTYADRS